MVTASQTHKPAKYVNARPGICPEISNKLYPYYYDITTWGSSEYFY